MGATGRVLTHLLLDRGVQVRALVRSEDDRAASLRAAGAEVLSSMLFCDIGLFRIFFKLSSSAKWVRLSALREL